MAQHHTIGKLLLELELPARQNALSIQDKLGAVCKDRLVYALQELLDSWADAGTLLRVDRLEIDLGECTTQQLEKELPERIISYLRGRYPALQQQAQLETGMERHPMTQGYFDSWLYFLEHGLLPDTSHIQHTTAWEAGVLEILATATPALERCRQVLETKPAAINRMVLQFSRPFIRQWIQAYAGPAQQPVMQLANAWEECCYATGFLTALRSVTKLTLSSLPERTDFQRRLDEWSIQRILSSAPVPEPATLLEQMMTLSFGAEQLPVYVHALQQLPSLPGAGAALVKTALLALHTRYAAAGKISHLIRSSDTLARDLAANKPAATSGDDKAAAKPDTQPDQQAAAAVKEADTAPISPDQRKDKLPADANMPSAKATVQEGEPASQARPDTSSAEEPAPAQETATSDPGQEPTVAGKPTTTDKRAAQREKPGTPPEGLRTYVNNAGLILLHPYLHILFNALGLLEKRTFKKPAAQDKAVQLLGFLASGETDIPEYDLVFPKLLCGLLPEDPVDRFVELTELDKTEANQLLEAVINNWNALGSTSADGLRGNFLMREGKLQWQGDEWRLRVTQTSYDLLLNRLPWALSVVRLPWMPWVLKTEWV